MTTDSLFEQLKHPNPHMRSRAMWELADNADETMISRLMANLGEEDVVYRRASVKTLGAIGIDTVSPLIESLLNSDNVTVRGSCAKALAQIAVNHPDTPFPPEGIAGLKTALNDANPVVNIAAAMALGEIGSPALEALKDTLETTDNVALAVAIVNALAAVGNDRAAEILATLTEGESVDSYVREMATSALSRLELVSTYKRPKSNQ
ncbi:HEAT repeat domain-containing protein [Lusitaniella coriacea LEGE 07157]|uniref:HEAT repeat domain-containing protein n=1 Tax=Lusitaniella coriacea LEGE 07157 TaxID=945747 RepID=A0A8J7DU27_9CYAN|nr:HEAT repeat domain-containing protein [Lusitaniella coriacea]MBE9114861.1 HEAT repeat domain-containing protein [Lusitaniella coriacea LEGE 07157]